jgi:toxin ParE1/3/4
MTWEYLPVARRELIKAAAYYFGVNDQLGRDFLSELHRTIDRVVESPEMGSHTAKGTRRRRIERFPFDIIYRIDPNLILIVAVAHHWRRPTYWSGRR